MSKNEIIAFLKRGESVLNVRLNDSLDNLVVKLGEPENSVGDENVGFWEYNHGLRIGYFHREIDELAFMFYGKSNIRLPIEVDGLQDLLFISEKTTINEFLKILNFSDIKWKSNDESNREVFSVRTEGEVFVLFDLDTGYISKISRGR